MAFVGNMPRNNSTPALCHSSAALNVSPALHNCSTRTINQDPKSHEDENTKVIINVSGKKFETYLSTLQKFPNTLLGNSKKRNLFLNKDNGEYFFDRHRKAFNGILYYYQSNGILECPFGLSESLFTQEVLFFEIDNEAIIETLKQNDEDDTHILPSNPYLSKIWVLFEKPNSSMAAKGTAILSIAIIVLSIICFCLETLPQLDPGTKEGKHMETTWFVINSVCNAWFTLEYVLRLISAPRKMAFVKSAPNVIDLLSIIPYYVAVTIGKSGHMDIEVLKVVRVVRVIRIFKLTRHSRGLNILANTIRESLHELLMLALFLVIAVILFSSAAYFAESSNLEKRPTSFRSIPHGFWWAVVTMTTVGYGDMVPSTILGKMVNALCAICGVLVIALPVPVIVSNFERFYKEEQTRRDRENELEKKKDMDDQMAPMRMGMKIMTDASILLSGGKESENHDPRFDNNNGSSKFDSKFSFRINKKFNAPFSDDADHRLNHKYGSNNSTLGGPCNTPRSSTRSLVYNGSNKWRDSINSNNLLGVTSD